MGARRKSKRAEAQLAFDALSIEGGLLSPEWLSKVAQLGAGQQTEPEYRIPKGLNLRDEIGRYWRIAQAHWADFEAARTSGADARATADRFVVAILRDAFGFASLTSAAPIVLAERSYPIGHAALGTRVPVVVAPAGIGIDTLAPEFGDENRRRSAFGLVQEYLNADEGALWGLVSDGVTLRIARDNASLTRPAWIEADLARIFAEQRFADFAALWLLVHETRFGESDQPVTECALERWREAGRAQGTVARERLRFGVEDALLALGQGFLAHPANQELRGDLQSGALTTKEYFNQLLRLVYRLIFLLTVEERGLLHPDGTDEKSAALYADGYSMRRLRERAVRRSAHDRFADLWEATKIVFASLATGETRLGLPALAGIFAKSQCPALDASKLENRHLSLAMFKLSWIRDDASLSRVNWRDMGPEELGSVYESLLELVPQITKDGRQFAFATGGETKGHARKTTGSYYTPDSLVQVLLDSALEPVVAETIAKNPEKPAEALLRLSIVDPACGSGHFLLAAARRLAAHVARLEANGTPSAREYRHALRQVIGRCIYGVDLNPMAVELCKVSLWMEAVEPGLPLTFLNSHIQHGNALLGTTPELMAKGIPDVAWEPIAGDDKKVASALKRRNKAAAGGQRNLGLFAVDPAAERDAVTRAVTDLEAAEDADIAQLTRKESRWDSVLLSAEYRHQKLVADTWCAAFVWPKQPGPLTDAAPTMDVWRQLRDGQGPVPTLTVTTADSLAKQHAFFHWHLQFPHLFARGGFDVALGNPPWERLKIEDKQWFAARDTSVTDASHSAERSTRIESLETQAPALFAEYQRARRQSEASSHFLRASGRYPDCGRGDVNTYSVFTELNVSLIRAPGRVGCIVPSGVATDNTTRHFFQRLVDEGRLRQLLSFFEVRKWFPGTDSRDPFCLLTIEGRPMPGQPTRFAFELRDLAELRDPERTFSLDADAIRLLNPNTRTAPIFRSRRDADVSVRIARSTPVLVNEATTSEDSWGFRYREVLHMSHQSSTFAAAPGEDLLPLYEAKMMHAFNHRWATYSADGTLAEEGLELTNPQAFARPRYWAPLALVQSRLGSDWVRDWRIGWRDICRSTDERTCIFAALPICGMANTLPLAIIQTEPAWFLIAALNSFPADYAARQRLGGTHLTMNVLRQVPVPPPSVARTRLAWSEETAIEFARPRVLELTYTAWDMEPFARDLGYEGTPFRWDPERRAILRCELDAAFFHLYGLSRDDTDYVLDTFPIVRRNDEKSHGEYRTKRVILEIYDALAKAAKTGKPYQTALDPAPAAPGASHGIFVPDGTPRDYAEALRTGLLFTLIRRSGDTGISQATLSRALLWVEDAKHAASWLDGSALADFERVRSSDPLLVRGAAESQTSKLLAALEDAKAITRDANGVVRLRAGGSIPNWLPQTPTLAKLASVMRPGLERADVGVPEAPAAETPLGKAKPA
jgi:hypothetical protein